MRWLNRDNNVLNLIHKLREMRGYKFWDLPKKIMNTIKDFGLKEGLYGKCRSNISAMECLSKSLCVVISNHYKKKGFFTTVKKGL